MSGELKNRRILYGRRSGHRLKPSQKTLVEEFLPAISLPASGSLDPRALMPAASRLVLEVGFGGGENLAARAARDPETLFIGCEPFINGVVRLAAEVKAQNLSNVRIHADDARDVIDRLAPASVDAVFVLFPDPWPKTRHHKRRFVGRENLAALARIMRPGGTLIVATDIMDYARWTMIETATEGHFRFLASASSDWKIRPEGWVETRYEAKALAGGRKPVYLQFECKGA